MVILWTDALIYLLLLATVALGIYLLTQPTLQRPLNTIANSRTGMLSLVVLVFFALIGLMDSIHFKDKQHGQEVISLLDAWAQPLRDHTEKTYSAPFAAYLYSKEMVRQPDGSQQWTYPRLQYGAAHLANPEQDKAADIAFKVINGFCKGAGLIGLAFLLAGMTRVDREQPFCRSDTAKAVWLLLFALIGGSYALIELCRDYHVFGTDKVGEDVFYQAVKSIRTGLVIGCLTTLIMLPLAIVFGIMAGFFKGWIDDLIQFSYTTLNSIPGVLLIAASILMVQVYMSNHAEDFNNLQARADLRLLFLCLILGVTSWTGLCRMLRAETLKLREMEYVQAAYALGVKPATILYRHILPNVMHIVLISVVLDFSSLVLAEAVLSYVNIGVDPATHSWGNMINGARLEMAREPAVWWCLTAAFVFMFVLVLAANLFADTVQEAFDPRRAGRE